MPQTAVVSQPFDNKLTYKLNHHQSSLVKPKLNTKMNLSFNIVQSFCVFLQIIYKSKYSKNKMF